jgi:polyisoprenoid-binding protein YceI
MKKILFGALALVFTLNLSAQKFFTKEAKVSFDATSSLEPIAATTNKGTLVIDATAGKLEAAVLVKGFHFEKALMEEHFNENYLESGKFPKATFAGDIVNKGDINLKKDGDYNAKIKGKLTMHGATKDVETTAKLTVKGGAIVSASAAFVATMEDYKIAIPGAVKDKIAKTAKISVSGNMQTLK